MEKMKSVVSLLLAVVLCLGTMVVAAAKEETVLAPEYGLLGYGESETFGFYMPVSGKCTVRFVGGHAWFEGGIWGNIIVEIKDEKNKTVLYEKIYEEFDDYDVSTNLSEGNYSLVLTGNDCCCEYFVSIVVSYTGKRIIISDTSLDLLVGGGEQLNFTSYGLKNANVVWKSTNPEIAKVDQNGTVTGVAQGTTTVSVSSDNVSASCTVTVYSEPKVWIEMNGNTYIVKTIPQKILSNNQPVWSSSNKKVAKIDSKGCLTPLKMGTTTVAVKVGDYTAKKQVTIKEDTKIFELLLGETLNMQSRIKLIKNYGSAKWKSGKKSVVKVNQKGVITAVQEGTAKIVAIVNDVKYTIPIKVVKPELNYTSYHFYIGDTAKLKFTNVKDVKAAWSSSNPSVVSVNSSGKITAKRAGTATVTAKVNGRSYSCTVKVDKKVYGTLRGTVTYYFNSNFGWRPDTNAKITVKDTVTDKVVARGIADGVGNYFLRVPIGSFWVEILSSGRFPKSEKTLLIVKEDEEYVFNASFNW